MLVFVFEFENLLSAHVFV